jgi:flagellar hook-associated protein 1 FlgK
MGNIFVSLQMAAQTLQVLQRGMDVTANNVANANSPGYVRQRLDLVAKRFQPEIGLAGGLEAGQLLSARQEYLERAVRVQSGRFGSASQQAATLAQLEPLFEVAQNAGIPAAIDALFQSFAQWSVNPNDGPSRENVLRMARSAADSFNYVAISLGDAANDLNVQIRDTVGAINRIGEQLSRFNADLRRDRRNLADPGLDAEIHAALEELAGLVDFSVLRAEDGSFSVYIGGQTPLVLGDRFFPLRADLSAEIPAIRDAGGDDITNQVGEGKLAGLLRLRTGIIPGLMGDLDRLASGLADRVNEVLRSGVDRNGQTPVTDLFTYDSGIGAAATLGVTGIQPEELAGAVPSAPGGNGNALILAALGTSREIDDSTFTQFYGLIAGRLGRELANARKEERTQGVLLGQAKTLRADESAVSLDEEAVHLLAFQRAYQATAQLVRALDEITQATIGLLR